MGSTAQARTAMSFYATIHWQVSVFGCSSVNSPTEEVDLPLLFQVLLSYGCQFPSSDNEFDPIPGLGRGRLPMMHDESRWLSILSFTIPSLVTYITKVYILDLSVVSLGSYSNSKGRSFE